MQIPVRLLIMLFLASLALTAAYGGEKTLWIDFDEVTDTHLIAPPGLGAVDPEEKDTAVGDLTGNGLPDLVVARKVPWSTPGGRSNALFINEGGVMTEQSAKYAPAFADETDDRFVIMADVNGNGWLDVITATTFGDQPRIYINLGLDSGEWQGLEYQADRLPVFDPPPKFCAVASGDVTGNGSQDLFFVDYDNDLNDRLLINDGNGFFTDETDTRLTPEMSLSQFGTSASIGDFNGNGLNDIMKVNALGANVVTVLYNGGDGVFNAMDNVYSRFPYMSEIFDFNNNGRLDLFVVDDGQDRILINQGNDDDGLAIFVEQLVVDSPHTASFGGNITIADMDGSGYLDVLVSDVDVDIQGCNRRLAILRNDGDPNGPTLSDPLANEVKPWLTHGTHDTAVADFNGNGAMDLWVATCDGNRLFFSTRGDELFRDAFDSSGR